ncbi:MAG TPA: class I SAM-dependent methyltransferase [Anaerolineales bacterium]
MTLVMDPAGSEIRALQKTVQWKGKRVLEIGSGDGRLTLRLAAFRPRHIDAIDPDAARLRLARRSLPAVYRRRISYHTGHAESLRYPRNRFDIVIFSWAL